MPRKKNKKPEAIVLKPIDEVVNPFHRVDDIVSIPIVITDIEFRTRMIAGKPRTEAVFRAWRVFQTEDGGFDTQELGLFLTRSLVLIDQLKMYKVYVEETGQYPIASIKEVKLKNGRRYFSMLGEITW